MISNPHLQSGCLLVSVFRSQKREVENEAEEQPRRYLW